MTDLPPWNILAFLFAALILSGGIVSADPVPYQMTSGFIFTRNGNVTHDPIQFQMICYGHTTEYFAGDNRFLNATADNPLPLKIVSDISASCGSGECLVSSYGYWNPAAAEDCALNGTVGGAPFSENISITGVVINCTDLDLYSKSKIINGTWHYYSNSPEYDHCLDLLALQYNCSEFASEESTRYFYCEQNLHDAQYYGCTPSFEEFSRLPYKGERYCEFQVPLPPGDHISGPAAMVLGSPGTRMNPIEAFYCSILQIFGERCE